MSSVISSQRFLVILLSCLVAKNCISMTNAIPLNSLLEMRWTKFEESEVYGYLKPVVKSQIVLYNGNNLNNGEEISYSLFKTDIPWFSLIKISKNKNDGLVRVMLDLDKMQENCEKCVPVLLPFELEQARSVRTFVDLFYLPEHVIFYPNRASLLTFVYPASADIKIYTKPTEPEIIDKMIINSLPNIRERKPRARWMNKFNALNRYEMPFNLKEAEHIIWKNQTTSVLNPCEMFKAVINSNSISIRDKILPLQLQTQIQVREYSETGLLTNKVVFSKYKIDGYPSVCAFSAGSDEKNERDIIYQVEMDVEAYFADGYKKYSVPIIQSLPKAPDSISEYKSDVAPMMRIDGDGWDIVLDGEENNVVWFTYGRSVLDQNAAVLKSVRFCKKQMVLRRYSSLSFNPLTSYLVDGYQLFYYW